MRFILNKNIFFYTQKGRVYIYGKNIKTSEYTAPVRELLQWAAIRPLTREEICTLFENPEEAERVFNSLVDANILKPEMEIVDYLLPRDLANDAEDEFREIYRPIRGYTMLSPAACYAIYSATKHIANADIPGDIVMTGVWRGGAAAICAQTLRRMEREEKRLWLYDSFDWCWPEPKAVDGTLYGRGSADTRALVEKQKRAAESASYSKEQHVRIQDVKELICATEYPEKNISFIEGFTQETLPNNLPDRVALAHLDTDFYESTSCELAHLYPLLTPSGILIIDDYPTEHGARKAVDEYFGDMDSPPFMSRIDYQGRLIVKPEKLRAQ